jgi:hypothetical protein
LDHPQSRGGRDPQDTMQNVVGWLAATVKRNTMAADIHDRPARQDRRIQTGGTMRFLALTIAAAAAPSTGRQ